MSNTSSDVDEFLVVSCGDCKFFDDDAGECRRYPPTVMAYAAESFDGGVGFTSQWPSVRPDDWCGEWKEEDAP